MNRREKEKYLENFEMWLGRKMEVIKWTDKVRNKGVLRRVGQMRTLLKTTRKQNRNSLPTRVT